MADPTLAPLLRSVRQHLTALYGDRLAGLVLYASHARGDARPSSDIDLALVLRGPVDAADEIERTADLVADAVLEHGRFVSLYPVSDADFASADRALVRAVREEGVEA